MKLHFNYQTIKYHDVSSLLKETLVLFIVLHTHENDVLILHSELLK
jgi:hypothetical protein